MSGVAEVSSTYLAEMASNSIPFGYKQTEIGVIPEDWEIFSLGQSIAKTQLGGNYKNSEHDTGQPLIKMGNLGRGFVKFSKQEFVIGNASESDLLNYGDVLFNTRNTLELVGKVAIWKNELPKAYFNSNLMRISFKEDLVSSNLFMNALMNSERFIKALSDIAIGTTSVAAIYNRDLFLIKVALPTKKEQTAIANALFDVDALISELEKLIAKKQAIKTATMQQLLTGRTRLPQFALREDGTPKGTKPSELGEIPEDWEVVTLGDIAEVRMCKRILSYQTAKNGEIPFFKIGTFGGEPDAYISTSLYREFKAKFSYPEKGDVLISAAGTLGKMVVYDGRPSYFQDSNIVWLEIDKRKISNEYLYQYYKVIKWASSEGSTISRLYNGIIKASVIGIPSLAEQTAIATILSDMDEEIQALKQRLGKTRQIKQGMMQELLTGKTRLIKPSKEVIHE
ncbi:restriction endonuclease subunit S [Vibrio cholerae]